LLKKIQEAVHKNINVQRIHKKLVLIITVRSFKTRHVVILLKKFNNLKACLFLNIETKKDDSIITRNSTKYKRKKNIGTVDVTFKSAKKDKDRLVPVATIAGISKTSYSHRHSYCPHKSLPTDLALLILLPGCVPYFNSTQPIYTTSLTLGMAICMHVLPHRKNLSSRPYQLIHIIKVGRI
jgi:hypothetical protein